MSTKTNAEGTATFFLYDCDYWAAVEFFKVGNKLDDVCIVEVLWGPERAHEVFTRDNGPWRAKIRYIHITASVDEVL